MESVHHVSTSSKVLFSKVRRLVPPLLEKFHKGLSAMIYTWLGLIKTGQHGRVAVIGGCSEYVRYIRTRTWLSP